MSGTTQDWNGQPGVPGGRLESEAAVREGVRQAYSATAVNQGQASMFIVELRSVGGAWAFDRWPAGRDG